MPRCRSILCMACPDQGTERFLQFGTYQLPVLPWNCRKRNIVYAIKCRCCCKYYIGQTSMQINNRVGNHRRDLTGTSLDMHFRLRHPGVDMYRRIRIYILSEEIQDTLIREGMEQNIRRNIREGEGTENTSLLNVHGL